MVMNPVKLLCYMIFASFFLLDRVPRSAAFLSFSNLASICSAKLF